MIFMRYPFDCQLKCLNFEEDFVMSTTVKEVVASYLGYEDFQLLHNGKIMYTEEIPNNATVQVIFSLPGGKGGFGSMLRAIGAQIEKTTNREACRDLSGRRLRDINEEQRLKKWIAKEAEREAEKLKRRKARLERLKSKPAHNFFDFDYQKEISELPERVNEAVQEGLQKVKQPTKRPHEKPDGSELPKKTWISDEFLTSSSDSDSDENNKSDESASKISKMMSHDSSSSDSNYSNLLQSHQNSSKENSSSRSSFSEQAENVDKQNSSQNDIVEDNKDLKIANTDSKETENNEQNSVKKKLVDNTKDLKITKINVENVAENEVENDVVKIAECSENLSPSKPATTFNSGLTSDVNPSTSSDEKSSSLACPPINLMDFQNVSDLEKLGLDALKAALMARGMKCGGTVSDRAQRLWKVRGLQPQEWPFDVMAKKKGK